MVKKILFVIALVVSTVIGCYAGKVSSSLDLMDRNEGNKLSDVDLSGVDVTSDDEIVNILLVGADKRSELGSEKYGRSDTVMIATLDNKHNLLKLTSLMRDMYVDIPGSGQHKFNAAYSYGGPDLLYKTIATNFGITLDGYVEVDFKAFRDIVDEVGGVDITLTQQEAQYLNTTNYISGKKNRNVVAGLNRMNGAQALGYCRVRKIANVAGTNNDQGRTERQRWVMEGIFKKVKQMPMSKWMKIIDVVMPNITTDISNKQIISYATTVVSMGTTEINQYRIPVDGYYSNLKVPVDGWVLQIDTAKNKELLQDFIFDYDGKKESTTESAGDQAE